MRCFCGQGRRLIAGEPVLQQRLDILLGFGASLSLIGRWKGKSFIKGGRAWLRHPLYMPALIAITGVMR